MTYFLEDIAHYLYNLTKGDFRKLIVVFPNRRARLFFNNFLAKKTQKPVWAPAYFTIFDFVQKISGMQIADPLTLVFLLFKVYKEVTGSKESFDSFYYYCEMILADFDDIDKYMVDAKVLYSNLSNMKAIEDYTEYFSEEQYKVVRQFWESFSNNPKSGEKEGFISIWDVLFRLYHKFNDVLQNENIAYEGKAYRKAVEIIKTSRQNLYKDNIIAFVGFNALNKSEEILFDEFKKSGNVLFFWDYQSSYIDNKIHEAGYFLRDYIKRYPPPTDFSTRESSEENTPVIKTLAVPSNISQAKVVPMCLEMLNSSTVSEPERTALVLADEGLLLPVVNSLPKSIEKINISMGYPVTDTSVYAFLVALTDLQSNKKAASSGNTILYYHRDYFAVINHNFLMEVKGQKTFQLFQKESMDNNRAYIDPFAIEVFNPLYQAIFTAIDNPKKLGAYLLLILERVAGNQLVLNTEDKELKWQLEVLHSIHKVLVRFDELLSSVDIQLSLSTVLNLMRRILAGISVPFSGEPLTGLQIMGILETRTLDFEKLVILSMNEGKFPKSGHVPSLIPYSLREGFSLPTIRHQDAIYAYYFYRLLHRVKEVVLVYNTKSDGLQKGEPSRFIYQLRYNSAYNIEKLNATYSISSLPACTISADKSTAAIEKLNKYLRPEGYSYLSPSALNTYLNCKLRFYFKYIEKLDEQEDITEDIEANVFGSILHKAMEKLYADFRGKLIQKSQFEEIRKNKKIIQEAIDSSFAEEFFNKAIISRDDYSGSLLIVREVIEKYVKGIIEYDSLKAPIKILSLEQHYGIEIPMPELKKTIAIGGIIDRIDEKEGVARIIDYKTGRKSEVFRSIDELFTGQPSERNSAVFQTFLYSWILVSKGDFHDILPGLFFVRDIYSQNFDYHIYQSENRKKSTVENFENYLQEFQERITPVFEEIFNKDIPFSQTEDAKYCGYCPYKGICMREQ